METSTLERAEVRGRERAQRQELLRLAVHLPELDRTLITAHFDRGMSLRELALVHGMTRRRMRCRLDRLKKMLADPCFLLAARFVAKLPAALQPLARGYWLEGATLRELCAIRGQTLHRVRYQIIMARSLLLLALAGDRPVSEDRLHSTLGAGLDE